MQFTAVQIEVEVETLQPNDYASPELEAPTCRGG